MWENWGDERGCDEGHWHAHTKGLWWGPSRICWNGSTSAIFLVNVLGKEWIRLTLSDLLLVKLQVYLQVGIWQRWYAIKQETKVTFYIYKQRYCKLIFCIVFIKNLSNDLGGYGKQSTHK